MPAEPATWTIGELSGVLASGEMSPVALAESALEAIDAYDDTLKAFIDVYRDDAIASAQRAAAETESGHHRGPLHGIPIAVKDNIFVAGKRTTMGSKIHADFIPDVDAGVTSRLADAAAVVIGKTNMHEYALGGTTDNPHWGTCRNPWDLTKTPGGSSGGSAVAVATGMAVAALGSDTSGSIRIPAALCGLVGLKPTYGRVSRFGVFPEAWTLDHVGPITRTVRDAALVLDAISGHDPRDPGSLHSAPTRLADSLRDSCEGVVIGVEEDFWFTDIDDAIAASLREALRALERKGARVHSVSVPRLRHTEYALTVIDTAETSTVHHANLRDRPQDYGTTCDCYSNVASCPRPSTTSRRSRSAARSDGTCTKPSSASTSSSGRRWAVVRRRSVTRSRSSTTSRWSLSTA
jgi:aspartyl-tRNA(Asn)/glutamyl-tRNA(Gln) amidotransferase subunit A